MKTVIRIDGMLSNGTGVPPHLTIHEADFVPRVGDTILANGALEAQVVKVVFEFSMAPEKPHYVHIVVNPEKSSGGNPSA